MAIEGKDVEELFIRRISAEVTDSVDRAIKRRYFALTIACAIGWAVATWLGGSALLFSMVNSGVSSAVEQAVTGQFERIREAADRAAEKNAEAKARLDQIDGALIEAEQKAKAAQRQQAALDEQLRSSQERAGEIEGLVQQAKAEMAGLRGEMSDLTTGLNNDRARYSGELAQVGEALQAVASLSTTVQNLQDAVLQFPSARAAQRSEEVTAAADAALGQVRQDRSTSARIDATLRRATSNLERPTVYLQFSGSASQETLAEVRAALDAAGFNIPGMEHVPSQVTEVRFFHDEDRRVAEELATKTTQILKDQGFPDIAVAPQDYTGWGKVKPPKGTVELWLNLPAARS